MEQSSRVLGEVKRKGGRGRVRGGGEGGAELGEGERKGRGGRIREE